MAFKGFGKDTGPGASPKPPQNPFDAYFPRPNSPSPPAQPLFPFSTFQPSFRPNEASIERGDESRTFSEVHNGQASQRSPPVTPLVAFHNDGTGFPAKNSQVQDKKRNRALPSPFSNEGTLRNSGTVIGRTSVLQRTQSPPFFRNNRSGEDRSLPRPTSPSPPTQPLFSPPPFQPSFRLTTTTSTDHLNISDDQTYGSFAPSARVIDAGETASKPIPIFPSPKRSRSPSLLSYDKSSRGNSSFTQPDDSERQLQAKARRLARFKDELSQPEPSNLGIGKQKVHLKGNEQSVVEKRKLIGERLDVTSDHPNSNISSDYEAQDSSSSIIIGICQEMCPDSERGERERKGDLDQYERLDGDINQTSKSLAVKKYTRTAEREANLIRPMPVLQKTMHYLLELLDQPYDAGFLGLYNFLWDRMRAIRMDLRMQHIFNLEAITMLEQMIRLHIIAMHELCESTKGEGFSEGFDAHLNIEQMNKTSVELFQLYDDHRKNGRDVRTEREFRGYYALLKLDKHPGYKVEPAELSLDLAKMISEVRQAPEVLFARDVARSCRIGNFIAFFRLARKATYLQACLMHAHFAKLRTQALACLHSGLQSQGIPVAQVAEWLGMEDEDIESLLEYHGFSIKEYAEPYMLKDGPFLNGDNPYPLKCSQLVHLKKSERIFKDVLSPCLRDPALLSKEVQGPRSDKSYKQEPTSLQFEPQSDKAYRQEPTSVQFNVTKRPKVKEEEMADFQPVPTPEEDMQVKPMLKPFVVNHVSGYDHRTSDLSPSPGNDLSLARDSLEYPENRVRDPGATNFEIQFRNSLEKNKNYDVKDMPMEIKPRKVGLERLLSLQMESTVKNLVNSPVFMKDLDDEEPTSSIQEELENYEPSTSYQDEEIAQAELILILRKWRRNSSRKRELREQKQLAANAALSSLSLGPPIRHYQEHASTFGEFNLHRVMRERHNKHERSWSKLNVSDVIVGNLSERNVGAKCLCWKIVLCSHMDGPDANKLTAGSWLRSKIMPIGDCNDDNLVISSPGLSIWKKWIHSLSYGGPLCCLSVIKDAKYGNLEENVAGASAVLFLVYECIPLELQKLRLENLLTSVPSGSCLPLLILSDSTEDYLDPSSIADQLGLHRIDGSQISSFSVVFLHKNRDGFFSDKVLREGLQWLASNSSPQPILHWAKTHELVLTHLTPSFKVLDKFNAHNASPTHCILAFNEALDRSIEEVANAASTNLSRWPCPEIDLLEHTDERRAVECYLPSLGWSSAARIEPLTRALHHCKLPAFPKMDDDNENRISRLEDSLTRYLTQTSRIMGPSLAKQEACLMLQKWARLELHESTYYIVPQWAMIFRRIFNWQLMSLSKGELSTAYVLEQNNTALTTSRGMDSPTTSRGMDYLIQPSLDEMLQVADNEAFHQPVPMVVLRQDKVLKANDDECEVPENEMSFGQNGNLNDSNNDCVMNGFNGAGSEVVVVDEATKEADRLNKLLEKCNMVQNMIDKKLSIYF